MLSDESLMELVKPYVEPEETFVRPVFAVKRSTGLYMLFGVFSVLATKYYALGFTDKKVILVETGMSGGKAKGGSVVYYNQAREIKVKKIIGGIMVTIITGEGKKLVLNVAKPRGLKNQKENIEEIKKMFGR